MPGRVQFDCFESVAGGFVAFGATTGPKGSTREDRLYGYGCQGETWYELQASIRRIAGSLPQDTDHAIRPAPIEVQLKPWPTDVPILIAPIGSVTAMFKGLANVGRTTPGRVFEHDSVTEVTFMKATRYSFICPEHDWKPELVSCLLHHIDGTLLRNTGDVSNLSIEDRQEIMAEILFRARE